MFAVNIHYKSLFHIILYVCVTYFTDITVGASVGATIVILKFMLAVIVLISLILIKILET